MIERILVEKARYNSIMILHLFGYNTPLNAIYIPDKV